MRKPIFSSGSDSRMKILCAGTEEARRLMRALNLPKETFYFSLSMEAGKEAILEVKTYVFAEDGEMLCEELKKYYLVEIPSLGEENNCQEIKHSEQ